MDNAVQNFEVLLDYIAQYEASEKVAYVLDEMEKVFASLAQHPERGTHPKELLSVGLREYREMFCKAYRVIYRLMAPNIYVMVIADGRLDMQSLLQRRLLQS